jgi:hypothetical protein
MTLSPRTRRNDGWVNHTTYSARMHKFGAIRSLADEAEAAGELSFGKGLALLVCVAGIGSGLWLVMP